MEARRNQAQHRQTTDQPSVPSRGCTRHSLPAPTDPFFSTGRRTVADTVEGPSKLICAWPFSFTCSEGRCGCAHIHTDRKQSPAPVHPAPGDGGDCSGRSSAGVGGKGPGEAEQAERKSHPPPHFSFPARLPAGRGARTSISVCSFLGPASRGGRAGSPETCRKPT